MKEDYVTVDCKHDHDPATHTNEQVASKKGGVVLFTSDVSACGVDYPNMTHVLQVGMLDPREMYAHQLCRTWRV
eukprot:5582613-Ditylum_brightwellii.AAC.1